MSNVVELRPKRTDAQKYYEALAKQRGIKQEPSLSDLKQDWLLHLADNGNLSRAAIRVGIVVQACRTNHAGKIDWPLARKSLAFLNYKPSTLDDALFELQCAGLLSSPAASNTALKKKPRHFGRGEMSYHHERITTTKSILQES